MPLDADFSRLADQDLVRKLDDAAFIARFEASEDWKLFREACERLARQAEHEMDRIDPIKDPTGIIERQVVKKLCRNVVRGIINGLKEEGKLAFAEAKERGLRDAMPPNLS